MNKALCAFGFWVLCASSSSAQLTYADFGYTPASYDESDDHEAVAVSIFGAGTTVADWDDVKANFTGQIAAFCDTFRIWNGRGVWCEQGGQEWASPGKKFYMERHDGVTPAGWTVYDDIDNNTLDLGELAGQRRAILVRLPRASVSVRNAGENLFVYWPQAIITGGNWNPCIWAGSSSNDKGQLFGYTQPGMFPVGAKGTKFLLVDPSSPKVFQTGLSSWGSVCCVGICWNIQIPFDPALTGLTVTSQGVVFEDGQRWKLTNAADMVIGY